ncbi:helix-turn-helix transcriptional regulator [Streptomyces sp. NPDC001658]
MDRRTELSMFLRSRRARVTPQEVGLTSHGRRRVPGLRREELAHLAGVSIDHYARLEQGRNPHVSEHVLDAIARALRLSADETRHLRNLARPESRRVQQEPVAGVRASLRMLLDTLAGPAYIVGPRAEFLAWNDLARGVFADFPTLPAAVRNAARLVFLDQTFRQLFGQSLPRKCADTVSYLRLNAGRHADDPQLIELIGTLSMRSQEFRQLWAQQDVNDKSHGRYQLDHPLVGPLDLHYEAVDVAETAGWKLIAYSAQPGSPSTDALRLIGSWISS